jgi:hypothetical protein
MAPLPPPPPHTIRSRNELPSVWDCCMFQWRSYDAPFVCLPVYMGPTGDTYLVVSKIPYNCMQSVSRHIQFSWLQTNNSTSVLMYSILNHAVFSTLVTKAYPTLGMSLSCLFSHNMELIYYHCLWYTSSTTHSTQLHISFSRLTPILFQKLNCHHPLVMLAQAKNLLDHLQNRAKYTGVGSSLTLTPWLFIFYATLCLSIQQPYILNKVQCLVVTKMSAKPPGFKK